MAADTSNNPFIVLAADAGATDIPVPTAGATIRVTKFRWVPGTGGTAADACVVTNSAGKVVWDNFHDVTASVSVQSPQDESDFWPPLTMKGLKVPTLSRGKLYVYVALDIG